MNYTIFTDGAYSQKNDEGAFAFVIVKDNSQASILSAIIMWISTLAIIISTIKILK